MTEQPKPPPVTDNEWLARFILDIHPTPEPRNHANIIGWPKEKPAQKIIAQEIAAAATFISTP